MRTIEHWIGGQLSPAGSTRTSPVWNPATGAQQAEVLLATGADVDHAVTAAQVAFEAWSQSSLSARTKVMFAFHRVVSANLDRLAEAITDEHGKVLSDARGEVQRGLEVVEFACGIPHLLKGDYSDQVSTDVDVFSFREPLGVVAGITPFNFPAMVPMWMFPVAIACGNAFVLKPSERDPSASMLLAELWAEAGLPAGVFSVVHGDKEAVDAILEHPEVAAVSFVGSTPIARYIHTRATENGKRVQALGGAKNHGVVLPDADIDFASDHLVAAAFGSAGERCMAISAAVAVGSVGDELVEAVNAKAKAVVVGSGRAAASEMGPVVSAAARDRIVDLIDAGEQHGGQVTVDGRGLVVPGFEDGFFVGPTVIDGVTPSMECYTQEIFGPVLSVVRTDDVDAAIELINANPYGNGTAIFTNSGEAARRFQRGVKVGMIGINVPVPVPMAYYSFGGWKDSLFGDQHVHGPEGVAFYTRAKVVTSRWPRGAKHRSPRSSSRLPDSRAANQKRVESMKTRHKAAAAVAAVGLLLSGCSGTGKEETKTTKGNDLSYAVITHSGPGDAFWDRVKSGAERAGEDYGVSVKYSADSDPSKQSDLIDAAVADKVDGIVVSMANPDGVEDSVKAAVKAGIPVVTINSGYDQWKDFGAITHIGQSETIAGEEVGTRLKDEGYKNVLCVIQEAGNVGLEERCGAVAKTAGGKVENLQVDGTDDNAVTSTITSKLQADDSIDLVLTLGGQYAIDAVAAVKQAGSTSKVATFDLSEDVINEIKNGKILFAVDQQPYVQGFLGVTALYLKSINGNDVGGGQAINSGPAFVTAENADAVLEFAKNGTR